MRTATAVPERLLLGAGPSGVPASVRAALASPTVGHTGSAGMEATVVNLLKPGERVICGSLSKPWQNPRQRHDRSKRQ